MLSSILVPFILVTILLCLRFIYLLLIGCITAIITWAHWRNVRRTDRVSREHNHQVNREHNQIRSSDDMHIITLESDRPGDEDRRFLILTSIMHKVRISLGIAKNSKADNEFVLKNMINFQSMHDYNPPCDLRK